MGILSGLKQAAKAVQAAEEAKDVVSAADRARAIAATAKANKAQTPIKASEAFGNLNLEGKGVVGVTQSDRTRVGGSTAGGSLFSAMQLNDPKYAKVKATWGVRDKPTASRLINESDSNKVWTTLLGAEDQLKTNPVVFDQMYKAFGKAVQRGDIEPEKVDQINTILRGMYGERADITDLKFKQAITDSFQARALVADLFQNIGIGGPQKAFGPEAKSILIKNTEPMLLHPEHGGDVPTFAAGPRIFSLDKTVSMRPDLNAGFPAILGGEDKGVSFIPVPNQTFLPDFWADILQSTGKEPGYMRLTRGIKGKGLPSQEMTDKWLTGLQKAGYAEGGEVGMTPEERVAVYNEAVKHLGVGGFLKKAAKAVAEAPVDRLSMGFKDVTERTPILQEAAQLLDRGELTAAQYAELVKQHKPVTRYASVPQPATPEAAIKALTSDKKAMFGKTEDIPAGAKADLRLDIPSYSHHGVWVNSVHQPKKPTVYAATSAAKNVAMKVNVDKALKTAKGGEKAPYATMSGEWNPMTAEEAFAKAQEYIDHPEWSQIGFDPERHGFFYDRETMEPITHADEVIQVGPLVLARNARHVPPEEGHKYGAGGIVLKAAEKLSKLFKDVPDAGGYAGGGKVGMAVRAAEELGSLGKKALKTMSDWASDVLPAAERDENLAKMLSDSRIKERLYHATPNEFDAFQVGGTDPSISGHAIWLSNDPSRQPAVHHIGSPTKPKSGVNVMPVYVQAKNPMLLDDPTMLSWAQSAYANGNKEFPELMPKEWADRVKENYDSIILADPYGRGDPHEVIMFNPSKIKSAIGNRGTYDTTKPELNKAKGGLTQAKGSK